ncbi:hypothetical protein ES703_102332 [subsurface metagenome]
MLTGTQSHTDSSDIIRFGMSAREYYEHWKGMSEAAQDAQGLADFLGGLSREERKKLESEQVEDD